MTGPSPDAAGSGFVAPAPAVPFGLGPLAAAPGVSPPAWLATLAHHRPLVLAPDGARGWFRGCAIVAFDPVDGGTLAGNGPESLHAAGAVLERAHSARAPLLAVALLPYSGDIRWALYERGAELTALGWRWWGSEPADGWPAPPPGPELADARALGRAPAPSGRAAGPAEPLAAPLSTSLDQPAFEAAVCATREAIKRGDVYVLNLTRTIIATTELSAPELFAALTERAPATMAAAWLPDDGGTAILSASPERFVRLMGHEVEIAPVKGTRPRGETAVDDEAHLAELLGSAKERAEHVMVVDLERNDVGRVCVPGSVRVDPLYELETTSYCHQAVSSVRGLMRNDASLGDLLEATFPCGSVTGAPKIAAMRIAEELECGERGAYTGSLVVAMPGELDSSVLIRTVELQPANGQGGVGEEGPAVGSLLRYGTGCGITVESDPHEEWAESVLKTQPLLGMSPPLPGPLADVAASAVAHSSPSALTVALKETCRIAGGVVPLWPYHRARLAGGGVPERVLDAIGARVRQAAAEWAETATRRARLTVVVHPDGEFDVEVAQRLSSLDVVGGLRVARVNVTTPPPLPAQPAKPDDRRYWDAAHHEAELAKAHQAVLVDSDGTVSDGSTSCVWIVERGVLITPSAPPAIPSVSRAFVLASAQRAGLDIRIERISWQRFESADEAFFTNAFGGAAPVRGRAGSQFEVVKGLFNEAWGTNHAGGAPPA